MVEQIKSEKGEGSAAVPCSGGSGDLVFVMEQWVRFPLRLTGKGSYF